MASIPDLKTSGPTETVRPLWQAPLTFLVEVLTGTFIFLVIGIAAVGLSYLVGFLKLNGIDPIIVGGLAAAKYLVFAADLILFTRFLWITVHRVWNEL